MTMEKKYKDLSRIVYESTTLPITKKMTSDIQDFLLKSAQLMKRGKVPLSKNMSPSLFRFLGKIKLDRALQLLGKDKRLVLQNRKVFEKITKNQTLQLLLSICVVGKSQLSGEPIRKVIADLNKEILKQRRKFKVTDWAIVAAAFIAVWAIAFSSTLWAVVILVFIIRWLLSEEIGSATETETEVSSPIRKPKPTTPSLAPPEEEPDIL